MLYKNKSWMESNQKNFSPTEMARKFNVDIGTIYYWERKHDVKLIRKPQIGAPRKNHFNLNFFQNIDSEEKAYILGFVMADGYIGSSNRTLEIKLGKKDEEILEKINTSLESKAIIRTISNEKEVKLVLSSQKMVNDLAYFGVVRNKTKILEFPKLEKEMYRHFMRGYFDGDGHVGEKQCALIAGSKMFFEGLMEFLKNELNFVPWYRYDEKDKCYYIQFSKKDAKFIQWMYKDSEIYLQRKKENYNFYWSMLK